MNILIAFVLGVVTSVTGLVSYQFIQPTEEPVGAALFTFQAEQLNPTYSANQYLKTDANGDLSWATVAAGVTYLATTTPWTTGDLVEVASDGTVKSTSTIAASKIQDAYVLNTGDTVSGDLLIADGFGMVIGHTSQLTTENLHEFQVLGSGAPADSGITIGRFSTNNGGAHLDFVKSRNSAIGSNTIVQDNDVIGEIAFFPDDGVDFATEAATLLIEVDDATPAAGDIGTAFVWSQMPGGGGGLTENMRLAADGTLTLNQYANAVLTVDATGIVTASTTVIASYIEDAFLLNTGDTGTGVYDFGGATSFELPNSSNPTVNLAGEIALNTAIDSLSIATSTTDLELPLYPPVAFAYASSSWTGTSTVVRYPTLPNFGEYIRSGICYANGTAKIVIGDGDSTTTPVSLSAGTTSVTVNKRFLKNGDMVSFEIGTPSSVSEVNCKFERVYER